MWGVAVEPSASMAGKPGNENHPDALGNVHRQVAVKIISEVTQLRNVSLFPVGDLVQMVLQREDISQVEGRLDIPEFRLLASAQVAENFATFISLSVADIAELCCAHDPSLELSVNKQNKNPRQILKTIFRHASPRFANFFTEVLLANEASYGSSWQEILESVPLCLLTSLIAERLLTFRAKAAMLAKQYYEQSGLRDREDVLYSLLAHFRHFSVLPTASLEPHSTATCRLYQSHQFRVTVVSDPSSLMQMLLRLESYLNSFSVAPSVFPQPTLSFHIGPSDAAAYSPDKCCGGRPSLQLTTRKSQPNIHDVYRLPFAAMPLAGLGPEFVEQPNDTPINPFGQPTIAIDCEGVKLNKTGQLCLVQMCLADDVHTTFVVDVYSLRERTFTLETPGGTSLRSVLENPTILKICFDPRKDVEALYFQFHVEIRGAFDAQLGELALRRYSGAPDHYVKSLQKVLSESTIFTPLQKDFSDRIDHDAKAIFEPEKGGRREIFAERPIHPVLLVYASHDVRHLCNLFGSQVVANQRGYYLPTEWVKSVLRESQTRTRWWQRSEFSSPVFYPSG